MLMKNTYVSVWVGIGFLILTGCKSDFLIDAYVSDLFLQEDIQTTAQMRVQIPSCEDSDRGSYEQKVLALFDSASEAKVAGCEEDGMESMLVIAANALVTSSQTKQDLAIIRQEMENIEEEEGTFEVRGVKLDISANFLRRVDSLMQENFETLSYEDIEIRILLVNDEREDILVSAYNVWIDGNPYQSYRRKKVGKRKKIDILFSDVVVDLALRSEQPMAFFTARRKQAN